MNTVLTMLSDTTKKGITTIKMCTESSRELGKKKRKKKVRLKDSMVVDEIQGMQVKV